MIFSKDKKPTEPGLYWCRPTKYHERMLLSPVPIHIFNRDGYLHVCKNTFGTTQECGLGWAVERGWLWGDPIPTPTVEPATEAGREAPPP
jgi:hypothetical protein